MNTIELLKNIAKKNNTIESFSIHTFPKQTLVQDKVDVWNEEEQNMFDFAISLKKTYGMPFWDSLLLGSFNNASYSEELLNIVLCHNSIKDLLFVDIADLSQYLNTVNGKRLAVNSRVKMKDGSIKHLPMLDFHISVSDINQKIVSDVCSHLKLNGYLLNSGESYHYIGIEPVDWDTLYMLLSKALLFCPIIDRAWISHQLQEKSCSLRIDKKNGMETRVLEEIKYMQQ